MLQEEHLQDLNISCKMVFTGRVYMGKTVICHSCMMTTVIIVPFVHGHYVHMYTIINIIIIIAN